MVSKCTRKRNETFLMLIGSTNNSKWRTNSFENNEVTSSLVSFTFCPLGCGIS